MQAKEASLSPRPLQASLGRLAASAIGYGVLFVALSLLPFATAAAQHAEDGHAGAESARETAPAIKNEFIDYAHPPREFEVREERGWKVTVEKELLVEKPDLAHQALMRLAKALDDLLSILPEDSRPRLGAVKWILMYGKESRLGGRSNGLEYFQKHAPRHHDYLDHRFSSAIVIYSAGNFVWLSDGRARMAIMHELAHAQHLEQWPEMHEEMYDTWKRARQSGLYEGVLNSEGKVLDRAYATQNHLEYFAELSCSYFLGNHYFPRNREELRTYDPDGYGLVERLWNVGQRVLRTEDPAAGKSMEASKQAAESP